MAQGVQIILINPKKEFLFQLRDNKPDIDSPGYWGLIGGRIDEGETPLEALKREIKEEICCEATNIKFLTCIKSSFIFKGDLDENIEYLNEHLTEGQKVQYFKLKDVKDLHLIPIFKEFILNNNKKT